MNTETSANSTLFRDRDLNTGRTPKASLRFSTEVEGEGMDLCLRGLLIVSLLAAMAFSGVNPDRFANVHRQAPVLPDTRTEVAVAQVQPAGSPAAKPL